MPTKHVTKLKLVFKITFLLTLLLLLSCNTSMYENNSEGFVNIENELKKKFGNNAYYTDIIIDLNTKKVTQIEVTQTTKPNSLKMQGWKLKKNTWKQFSEVDLTLKKGNIKDYMFQLNGEISLSKINEIKKNIPVKGAFYIKKISIISPENGDKSTLKYQLQVQQKNNNKKLEFNFDTNGYLLYQNNVVTHHNF